MQTLVLGTEATRLPLEEFLHEHVMLFGRARAGFCVLEFEVDSRCGRGLLHGVRIVHIHADVLLEEVRVLQALERRFEGDGLLAIR